MTTMIIFHVRKEGLTVRMVTSHALPLVKTRLSVIVRQSERQSKHLILEKDQGG